MPSRRFRWYPTLFVLSILALGASVSRGRAKEADEPTPKRTATTKPASTDTASDPKAKPAKVPADHVERAKRGTALFKEHVGPLLRKHCLECHGGKSVKADFDLSNRKVLFESGYVEKTAADSHLMTLIRHTEEPHMPFKAAKLPEAAITKIAAWIDLGAPYDKPLVDEKTPVAAGVVTDDDRQFWSFRPLKNVDVPKVRRAEWVRNDIDRFILAKLESQGLAPNEPAARRKLIRRVTLDLIGLPPTPEDVEAFVNDESDDAYEKVVDRLLESPHFGERWARHWMDVARFAESHGYEQDYDRKNAYHYRDFLVKALNADMPYDRFVRWQLAGDEVAPDEPLAWMATGFLGAGAFPTQLTETEFESARYDELDDIVGTVGTAFLGLTTGCARCHDHKFDPIPTADYYRLAATFTTTIRSEIDLPLNEKTFERDHERWQREHDDLLAALQRDERGPRTERLLAWLKSRPAGDAVETSDWTLVRPAKLVSKGGATLAIQPDGAILVTGKKPNHEEYTITFQTPLRGVRAFRLEALTHDSLNRKGPGRAGNGNFALSDFGVTARPLGAAAAKPIALKFADARATHQQNTSSLSVKSSVDGDPVSGWAVDAGGIGKDQAAVFVLAEPVGFEKGTSFTIRMSFRNNTQHALGRFRLSIARNGELPATVGAGTDAAVAEAFAALDASGWKELAQGYKKTLLRWFAGRDETAQKLASAVAAHAAREPKPKTVKVQVNTEGMPHMKHHADGRGYPHFYPQTHELSRGDVHQKTRVAAPGFLQVLMTADAEVDQWRVEPPEGEMKKSFRRTTLAEWMTDAESGAGPLLARVIVNRLWHHHFGRGIVTTPNDFGFQGERPTHPELLEWLAGDLVEHGWTLKRLHKQIVTSATYVQSSRFDEARAKVDRENRSYWRWTPRRLEAEAIRDSMLHVAGQLDPTMFGPGTLDPNHRRRSLYFFVKRSKLIPMMMLFDWPEHLVGIGRRSTTTIAPQALSFLNGPQCRQYAEGLAGRVNDPEPAKSIVAAFRLAYGRRPSARESAASLAFLKSQSRRYGAAEAAIDRRALVDLCQALLGSNEFVYID